MPELLRSALQKHRSAVTRELAISQGSPLADESGREHEAADAYGERISGSGRASSAYLLSSVAAFSEGNLWRIFEGETIDQDVSLPYGKQGQARKQTRYVPGAKNEDWRRHCFSVP